MSSCPWRPIKYYLFFFGKIKLGLKLITIVKNIFPLLLFSRSFFLIKSPINHLPGKVLHTFDLGYYFIPWLQLLYPNPMAHSKVNNLTLSLPGCYLLNITKRFGKSTLLPLILFETLYKTLEKVTGETRFGTFTLVLQMLFKHK